MFELGVIMAVIVGLGQLYKKVDFPVKYLPLVNIVLGLLAGFFIADVGTVQESVMTGLMLGLGASGLFDVSKIATKKTK